MKKLFLFCCVLSLICPPTVISQENLEECTIGVASGKATADGRPLLWKNGDGSGGDREVVYFKDGRFKHLALVAAGDSQWVLAGVNEFGFCIIFSGANDLPGESKKGIGGGNMMKLALQQCVTAGDFENLLKQTNVSGRRTKCNISVIDAFGGAAIFETGNFSYTRFDANDRKVAPKGYIIRANFTFTGGGDSGRARYDRANQLWQEAVEKDQLDYRYVLRKVCRDLSGAEEASYTPPETEVTENNTIEVLNTKNAISNLGTMWVALFHGVRPDENPSLTTFWTIMGEPVFSVAVPSWVIAESTAPEMDGAEMSPLCTAARDLHQANYLMGNGRRLLLSPYMLSDIWALTYPAEDRIFDQAESILTQWRQDYPPARQVAWFHRYMASEAMDALEEVIELLVQKGATNANLRIALYMRDLEKAEAFIKESVNINVLDGHGYDPLHYAVQNNQKEIIELLLSKGADINAADNAGNTSLHRAAQNGQRDIVGLLIDKGADLIAKNEKGQTPVDIALSQRRNEVVTLLIAKGADVSSIHLAAYLGDTAKVMNFIEQGSDVNTKNQRGLTPLHYAARRGHKEIVEVLLAHGANVNIGEKYYNRTAAEFAMGSNHREIVQLLVSKGADISPLHFALYMKDEAKARSLIEGGADVNRRTPYGTTPLDRAVDAGFKDIVELLIAKGANVNAKDNWDWTPLHSSAVYGSKNMVELLIAKGADINARDGVGRTPLWYAKDKSHTEIVELLRKHGAKE